MKTKSLIVTAKEKVELGDVELPELTANDILVETDWTGVSIGTERWIFLGTYYNTTFPLIPGYQRCGRVTAAGAAVKDVKVGDRVWTGGSMTSPTDPRKRLFGGHTAHAVVPATAVLKPPAGISDEDVALAKMAAISRHGIEFMGLAKGELVLLIGLGMIGNLAGQIARARGARVIALELDPERRRVALGKAADVAVDPRQTTLKDILQAEGKPAFDTMIDTSAAAPAMNQAFFHMKQRAKVLLQGYYPNLTSLDLLWPHVRELVMYNPTNQQPADLVDVFDLLLAKKIEIAPLALRFSLAEAVKEYPALLCDPARALSALIDWRK